MIEFAEDIADLFPIEEIDEAAEEARVMEETRVEVDARPQPPKVWKILFDTDGEDRVEENSTQTFRAAPTAQSSLRIELPDRPASPDDGSPSSEEELDSPTSGSSFLFTSNATQVSKQAAQDAEYEYREIVVDKNGQPRQAGATTAEGEFIKRFKQRAEQDLFVFLKGVLGRFFLTPHFHQEICRFLQTVPAYRKLVLMARGHCKTAIVSGGLPLHILIQPAEGNIYFPGMEGSECRILLAGENSTMAEKNLRVLSTELKENKTLRALWPHRCWIDEKPKVWSSNQIIIPRANEWPDPTIKAVGVGGAITGARPNVLIEDDLVSFKAMNSSVVMQEAIEWHIAARALLDKYEVESALQSLQFIIGTRWAVHDLYSYIINNDKTVEVNDEKYHRVINNGKILWPEKYKAEDIEQLRLEHGSMFYLLYLNSAADPSLTDFDCENIRKFTLVNGRIVFDGEGRDSWLAGRAGRLSEDEAVMASANEQRKIERGMPLSLLRLSENLKGGIGCRIRA